MSQGYRETVLEHEGFQVRSRAPAKLVSKSPLSKTLDPLVAPGVQVDAWHGFLHHR